MNLPLRETGLTTQRYETCSNARLGLIDNNRDAARFEYRRMVQKNHSIATGYRCLRAVNLATSTWKLAMYVPTWNAI